MGGKKKVSGGNIQGADEGSYKFDFGGKSDPSKVISKEAQAALLPVLQKKMDSIIGKSSGYFESLPKSVQNRVKALKKIQKTHDEHETQFKKEQEALEKKYEALRAPLYTRRSEIVNGEEPTAEELADENVMDQKEEEIKETKEEKEIKGIPNFWLETLKHHDEFGQMITPADEPVLKYLIDIRSTPVPDEPTPSPSFVLEFHFAPNEFFDEKILMKKYTLAEDLTLNQVMFQNVEGTEIKWNKGKNITVKTVTKQQKVGGGKGGRGGRRGGGKPQHTKTVTVEEPVPSFFNFFNVDIEDEDIEEEELGEILENDYELGEVIKTQIIPNAVMWFTGEVPQIEMSDDEGEDDGEDGDEDDEEEDEEEEDGDEAEGAATGPQGKPQQECKQQ